MIQLDWVDLLKNFGDVIERQAIKKCRLGSTFPNYAEFWGRFVLVNRSEEKPSKLRKDVTPELERIINYHYGVYYHLTIVLTQLKNLQIPLIDVATSLYHLATATDLVEKLCYQLLHANGKIKFTALDEETYKLRVTKYWQEEYQSQYSSFEKNFRPIGLEFFSVSKGLALSVAESIPNWKVIHQSFVEVRTYRNVFTHSLSPLKLFIDDQCHIPKPKYLKEYSDGLWSSNEVKVKKDQYERAETVIFDLAQGVILNLNELWLTLIPLMHKLMKSNPMHDLEVMQSIQRLFPYEESGGIIVNYDGPFKYPYYWEGGYED